jgi:DNA ligase-4
MNKDVFDIIRPQWLFDSIAKDELVPMSKKYFFHATAERMESAEYNNEDDDDDPERSPPEETLSRMSVSQGIHADVEESGEKEEDSEMGDWLRIEPGSKATENPEDDLDSVTDPDSDNEDKWFSIEEPQEENVDAAGGEVRLRASLEGMALTSHYSPAQHRS